MDDVKTIEIKYIKRTQNSRDVNKKDLHELMENIKYNGLLHPIGVRKINHTKYKYEIMYGHRRLSAFMKLRRSSIDAKVWEDVDAKEFLLKCISENLHRQEVTAFEMGRMIDLLKKEGLDRKEIASSLGVDKSKLDTWENIVNGAPKEYLPKIKPNIHNRFSKEKKTGPISVNLANKIVNMKSELDLSNEETKQLFAYAQTPECSEKKLRGVAKALVTQDKPIKEIIKKVDSLQTVRFELLIEKNKLEKVMKQFKSKSDLIKFFSPLIKDFILDFGN